ncbi:MAG TPA: isoprenylcysteine carboxylmethyltransferase family protein [Thermoanaerobaculia bacterium]|nr:isoprenylcysteine carboxylmethyltransferase family protein [Thermoanaerobaculia bacterium]
MRPLIFLKSALFTVLVPGVVALYVPYRLASGAGLLVFPRLGLSVVPAYLLLFLGVLIYLRCARDFAVSGLGTPAIVDPPRTLVVSGLYRWSRNPMYNGVLLVVLSMAWLSGSRTLLLYAACLFLGFHLFVVLYEEPHLKQVFGAPYARYCTLVPRWGAAFRPYDPQERTT